MQHMIQIQAECPDTGSFMQANMYLPMKFDSGKDLWFFLDDEREPPHRNDRDWVIFRTGEAMLNHIMKFGMPDGISFDHDLGPDVTDAHTVAKMLLSLVMFGTVVVPENWSWDVHSQNPVGAANLIKTLGDIEMLAKVKARRIVN